MRYRFDSFVLDTETMELSSLGTVIALEPQVFALLELLVSSPDRVVSKVEINERIWGTRVVTDASIDSRMRSLRRALGDSGAEQRMIRTVRGKGFRFVADVTADAEVSRILPRSEAAPTPAQEDSRQDGKPRIAVVPLLLLSEDTRLEPLADAIAHELIADLSRLRWLEVIAQGSTFKLRGTDPATVAATLSASYVLTGSLAVFRDHATVNVSLSAAENQATLWADVIECSLDELMTLRHQLLQRVVNDIEQRVQDAEAVRGDRFATENLGAWMAYFRGLRHANRFNGHDNNIARQLFEHAIAEDPGFALARAGLSFTHFQSAFVGYTADIAGSQQMALREAERAFELDPLDPNINLSVGRARYLLGEVEQAEPWFDRARELNPSSALSHYNKGLVHAVSARTGEIDALAERATSLSPIDPLGYAFMGTRALGRLADAELEDAARWSERAANAPLAHHLIDLIAMICAVSAGNDTQATFRRDRALSRHEDCSLARFYRAFPIRDEGFRQRIEKAFTVMGLPLD